MAVKRISGSTIAEVVIALTIIAVCFAVASQVFVQSNRSTVQFSEVREQTEFQSFVLQALTSDTLPDIRSWKGELTTVEDEVSGPDSCKTHHLSLHSSGKLIWQQEIYSEK